MSKRRSPSRTTPVWWPTLIVSVTRLTSAMVRPKRASLVAVGEDAEVLEALDLLDAGVDDAGDVAHGARICAAERRAGRRGRGRRG
jgi:hypothetical protein